jgi:hypothetical protein
MISHSLNVGFLVRGIIIFGSLIAPPSARAADVRFTDGRLTVKAQSTPLVDLLREIAQQSGIAMVLRGRTGQVVSIDLDEVPIEDVFNTLLRENPGSALVYSSESVDKPHLIKAYVLLRGDGSSIEEVIGNESGAMAQAEKMPVEVAVEKLREGAPEEFLQSLATLYPKLKPIDALYESVRHPDASVRVNALSMLAELGSGDRARQALENASNDTDVTVRSLALRMLGKSDGVEKAKPVPSKPRTR